MAATVKRNIEFLKSPDGNPPEKVFGKIAATEGILIPNAPLYLSTTSGYWEAANTSDGTGDTTQGLFVGLKNKGSTWPITAELAAGVEIEVSLIDTDDYYVVYVENNDSDAAMSDSYKGIAYGLRVSTTADQVGYVTMDVNNSHNTVMVVDSYHNLETAKASAADSPGRAIVRFIASNVQAEKASE